MILSAIGVLGGIIVFLAHVPLCVKIVRKTCAPSFATWAMWSTMSGLLLASQVINGKEDPWGMVAATIGSTLTFVLLLFYGKREWSKFETMCLALSTIGVLIWLVSDAATAQIAFLVALFIAGAPTVKNARKTNDESALVWGIFSVGFALTTIGVPDWSSITNWVQPVSSTIFNSIVFVFASRKK